MKRFETQIGVIALILACIVAIMGLNYKEIAPWAIAFFAAGGLWGHLRGSS